ncbi:hypothetical protein [Nocardia arizonensis]|uniref:hypothetical protein n=1 Tax=Nocardia arizonensis TaxID=1141647 RepID=UPI0006D0DCF2|nr:hypothetical protein [Nocardia arizonensis]
MSDDFIEVDDPDVVIDNSTGRLSYRGQPFSGSVATTGPNGALLELWYFEDGSREGGWSGWYTDGAKRYSGIFFHNRPVDEWQEWFPDGAP